MKEQEYMVNTGFMTDAGRIYSGGQTLTQVEYNLLDSKYKIRCSVKISTDFDREEYDFHKPKS